MIIKRQEFHINGLTYTVRSAVQTDAEQLSGATRFSISV